jgi:hypothetical protein
LFAGKNIIKNNRDRIQPHSVELISPQLQELQAQRPLFCDARLSGKALGRRKFLGKKPDMQISGAGIWVDGHH